MKEEGIIIDTTEQSGMPYAKVIIDIDHEKVDRMFTYKIPESLSDKVQIGSCVTVPFGKGDSLRQAYVAELTDETDFDPARIKEILEIAGGEIPAEVRSLQLAAWMKKRYGSTMINALKTVLPVKKQVKSTVSREVSLLLDDESAKAASREAFLKHQKGKMRAIEALMGGAAVSQSFLTGKLGVSASTLKSLEKQGVVRIDSYETYRTPIHFTKKGSSPLPLTDRQRFIVEDYLSRYDSGEEKKALLLGVTGSGKTEVYMGLIEGMLKRNKQVIMLIPEIALTYQTVRRFYERFGDVIAVMHSRLSAGEKYDQLMGVKEGRVKIMIGPRSALFTPFPDPGLILMDEEHETSYKSENMPRFHAREVAARLCEMTGAGLFLGSATPSVDSFYQAQKGRYLLYRLSERIGERPMPMVSIVDLRKELAEGNFSMFSRRLKKAMDDHLARGQQIMLFLNRRGIAGFVSCKSCGKVLMCPHCDVSLSEHRDRMICHYCGYEAPRVSTCPDCGSSYIYGFKAGTAQVEDKLKKMYPRARILRMDADTTKKKDDHEKILSAFNDGEADILIGTQMIVKGHDFPGVTLVGVLAADLSLFASDYTAPERTFQLLTQAVGRAGRGDMPGEAVIQTYQPEHYAVKLAATQDYEAFYEEEIGDRQLLGFPPACHLLAVLIAGREEEKTDAFARRLAGGIREEKTLPDRFTQMGPAPASIGRIRDLYRRVIYFRSSSLELLMQIKDRMEEYIEENAAAKDEYLVYFDFDPVSGF